MQVRFLLAVLAAFLSVLACAETGSTEMITFWEGLKRVTEENRLVKITQKQEAMAEEDIRLARSGFFPNINTTLTQTMLAYQPQAILNQFIVPTSEKSYLSFSLGVQQLLFDFERTASRYESARSLLESRKWDTKRVRNLVALEYALTYFNLLEAEKMVLVAGKEVEGLEAHLRDARALYEHGVITKNDLLQTEVRLSDARQRLFSARTVRSLHGSRINNLLALPLTAETELQDVSERSAGSARIERERAWELALNDRPEIQIADKTLESLGFEEQSVRAEYFPQFFVRGSFDYTENEYQVHENNWGVVFGMSMNISSGGSTRAGLSKVQSRKDQLIEQRRKLVDDVKLEAERYWLDMKNAEQKISVTRDAVDQADENRRINTIRYEEGVGTSTDVIDAITLLTVAETNYYRALYDLRRAEAGLAYATGMDMTALSMP